MKKYLYIFALASIININAANAKSNTIVATEHSINLPMNIGGRTVKNKTGLYEYQWPGVYFESKFKGKSIALKFDDSANNFRVLIDGNKYMEIFKPGKKTIYINDLTEGAHTIRLEKFSETQSTIGGFYGFFVPSKANILPITPAKRQFEFIGDSFTVGYGNLGQTHTCTTEEVYNTTNTSENFPVKVSKNFNADYQINASSGYGIVRNYSNSDPGRTLPVLYKSALFKEQIIPSETNWKPQIIIIGLGTNDFSTPVGANEKWKDRSELVADYIKTYTDFTKTIRAKNPNAEIILMGTNRFDGVIISSINKVIENRKIEGDTKVRFIEIDGVKFNGCHGHPDTIDEMKISKDIIKYLNDNKLVKE